MPKQSEFFEQMLQSAARVADMVFAVRFGQFQEAVQSQISGLEAQITEATASIDPQRVAELEEIRGQVETLHAATRQTAENFEGTYKLPDAATLSDFERDALRAIGLNVDEAGATSDGTNG